MELKYCKKITPRNINLRCSDSVHKKYSEEKPKMNYQSPAFGNETTKKGIYYILSKVQVIKSSVPQNSSIFLGVLAYFTRMSHRQIGKTDETQQHAS